MLRNGSMPPEADLPWKCGSASTLTTFVHECETLAVKPSFTK
jgi:hypothetical protein